MKVDSKLIYSITYRNIGFMTDNLIFNVKNCEKRIGRIYRSFDTLSNRPNNQYL